MRLFPCSDLHLERRTLAACRPDAAFDVLVCAGDVWEGEPERAAEAVRSLAGDRPAILVPGNHEHYRRAGDPRPYPRLLDALERAAEAAALHLLRGGRSVAIGGVRFVGATLWSDWSLAGRWLDGDGITDPVAAAAAKVTDPAAGSREYHGAILHPEGRPWSPDDAMAAHRADKARLAAALAEAAGRGPVVAVTHHPPLAEIVDGYRGASGVPWWVPAFYGTTALADLPPESRPALWISGHFHAGHDRRIGPTRSVANPVAGDGFRPDFIVEI